MKRFCDEGITAGVVTDCCGFGTAFVGTSNMRLAEERFEREEFGRIARWMIGARKKIRTSHRPETSERTSRRLQALARSSGGEDGAEMDPWKLMERLYDAEVSAGIEIDDRGFATAFVGSSFNTRLFEKRFDRKDFDRIVPWMMTAANKYHAEARRASERLKTKARKRDVKTGRARASQ